MIADADTVVEPLAMVIEPVHTLVANIAVARLLGAQDLARWAQIALLEVLIELKEADSFGFLDEAGVSLRREEKCSHLNGEHNSNGPKAAGKALEREHV